MKIRLLLLVAFIMTLSLSSTYALDDYTYDGSTDIYGPRNIFDSFDGTWDHDNFPDLWDGSRIGAGTPGGVMTLTENGVTFLRLQDAGNPAFHGHADPNVCKLMFAHDLIGASNDYIDGGVKLSFRMRIATTGPLDDQYPQKPHSTIAPWPARGIGYLIQPKGLGMISLCQKTGRINLGFSLCHKEAVQGIPGFEGVTGDILLMHNLLLENASQADVLTRTVHPELVRRNYVPVADATAWNTFDLTIIKGGKGTHQVNVSINGKPLGAWEVSGCASNFFGNYLLLGLSSPEDMGAFDVDYIKVSKAPAP